MAKKLPVNTLPYEEMLYPMLQEEPEFAMEYLNEALQDEDIRIFLIALRHLSEAKGISIPELAKRCGLNRQNLNRMLSAKGNPEWESINLIVRTLGFHLAVQPESFKDKKVV